MDTLRVAAAGRKKVKNQQVDTLRQKFRCLGDEFPQPVTRRFVAGRDNFNEGHDTVAADVVDHYRGLLALIKLQIGLSGPLEYWFGDEKSAVMDRWPRFLIFAFIASQPLQRQHIRAEPRRELFGKR